MENRVVYQFHGCFYHGCTKCYSSDDYNNVLNMSFGCSRANTNSVTYYLIERGFEVVEMWEVVCKVPIPADFGVMTSLPVAFMNFNTFSNLVKIFQSVVGDFPFLLMTSLSVCKVPIPAHF